MSIAQIHSLPEPIRSLVDDARRTGEPVHIVEDGAVIAQLIPEPPPDQARSATLSDENRLAHDLAILDDMDRLADRIGKEWPEGVSAVDAVRESRNRLDEDPATRRARTQAALEQLKQIGKEISATWPQGVSALDAVWDVRREL